MIGRGYGRRMDVLGEGWAPSALANLSAWYDGQDYSTLYQDSALTTHAGNGDVIGGWSDKSGNGYTLTQTVTAAKPTMTANVINGYAAPYYVTDDYLVNSALGTLLSGSDKPFSIALAFRQKTIVTRQVYGGVMNSATDTPVHTTLFWESGSEKYQVYRRDDSSTTGGLPSGGTTNTTAHVYVEIFAGTTVSQYIDGTALNVDAACNVGTMTVNRFCLGARAGALLLFPLDGYIGECIVSNGVISANDRNLLTQYLGNKWGVTVV